MLVSKAIKNVSTNYKNICLVVGSKTMLRIVTDTTHAEMRRRGSGEIYIVTNIFFKELYNRLFRLQHVTYNVI